MNPASPGLVNGFLILSGAVFLAVLAVAHRAAWLAERSSAYRRILVAAFVVAGWLLLTGALAAASLLNFGIPPTMVIVLLFTFLMVYLVSRTRLFDVVATKASFAALVLLQSFRLPLELLMQRAANEGVMPEQMSFSGMNYDIVTGVLSVPVGFVLLRWQLRPEVARQLVTAWNKIGMILLTAILVIAILSAPTPLRLFRNEPPNVWITLFPFVWLVTLLVPTAMLGHVAVLRKLRKDTRPDDSSSG